MTVHADNRKDSTKNPQVFNSGLEIAESGKNLAIRAEVPDLSAREIDNKIQPGGVTFASNYESNREYGNGNLI